MEGIVKHILEVIDKYKYKIFINNFTFDIDNKVKETDSLFEMSCCYPYLHATIHYSEEAVADYNDGKDLEKFILHELCHLITDPFYCKAVKRYVTSQEISDERERLTEMICNIALQLDK